MYVFDYALKAYRDRSLNNFGSPAPLVPFKLPFGFDVAITTIYNLHTHNFFELLVGWLNAVPGRTVELRMFGNGLIISDEPAIIKGIMSTEYSSFGRGKVTNGIWGNMLGDGQIFITDGDIWHKAKDSLNPHASDALYNELDFRLIAAPAGYVQTPSCRAAADVLNKINTARQLFMELALWIPDTMLAPKALKDLTAWTTGVTDRAYARDLSQKKPENYTMLDDFVTQKKSYKEIKEMLFSIMLGGKDPSSILITWAIFEMGKDPCVMKKMKKEVSDVCGTKLPTAADLRNMPYLRHVINETFRLHHPLGVNVRTTLKNVTLPVGGGESGKEPLAISKGTTIVYSLMSMQRRKDIYGEDADIFRPERWEEMTPSRWHFIPYNHGPRSCIGRNFGQQQVEYILARICQEYEEILIPPQREQQIRVELNVKMAHPCLCEFVKNEKF
ncbi:cytochrome P450 [Phlyctema vagabunda]|uniref:Cytochrome P450 n=1 Tax=Phlyctema vagabunda TaxID=108571 RepID=A0ABR4P5X5_9HELO